MLVTGYCSCSLPASVRCEICGAKLCGTCARGHRCAVVEKIKEEPAVSVEEPEEEPTNEYPTPYTPKPYKPRVRK